MKGKLKDPVSVLQAIDNWLNGPERLSVGQFAQDSEGQGVPSSRLASMKKPPARMCIYGAVAFFMGADPFDQETLPVRNPLNSVAFSLYRNTPASVNDVQGYLGVKKVLKQAIELASKEA